MSVKRSVIRFIGGMAIMMSINGCSMIDEDLSDCGKQAKIDYELELVTNMSIELETVLNTEQDASIAEALRAHLSNIFTDFAHDVDLSFYDTTGDSLRLQHDQHIMDANQASYTFNLPMQKYMHLASANVMRDENISLISDELCHWAKLQQSVNDTVSSQTTGLFTARQPMELQEDIDQKYNVRLYMANCAAALIIDPQGYDTSGIRVYTTGFATAFNICDSTYSYLNVSPIVRTTPLKSDNGELGSCSVTFPSRESSQTRTVIETTEPFIAEPSEESLWEFRIYLPNLSVASTRGVPSITETRFQLKQPLHAGQLKIIKAVVRDDGSVLTVTPNVGVSVTLDWKPGNVYNPDL